MTKPGFVERRNYLYNKGYMSNTIYILALEPLDTRYTGEWFTSLPALISSKATDFKVEQITGIGEGYEGASTTKGAFLNFSDTNIWKSNQLIKVAELFQRNLVKPGDKFLVADAWNPAILNIKYMSELLDIPVEIHSIWHAGSYDPNDFLGRKIHDKHWSYNAERSMFYASNYNYFATEYHKDLLLHNLHVHNIDGVKAIRSGLPFEYLYEKISPFREPTKDNLILFPHRIAPEKNIEIFKDLEQALPDYKFIVCQEENLSKYDYHTLLGKAKIVFSANLQETLGISCYEGMCTDAIPMVPDRLSYKEMYDNLFKYPSEWTISWDNYLVNKALIIERIHLYMNDYTRFTDAVRKNRISLENNFFSADIMIDNLKCNTSK